MGAEALGKYLSNEENFINDATIYDIVSIRDEHSNQKHYQLIDNLSNQYNDIIIQKFDDIVQIYDNRSELPKSDQIKEILDWSDGRTNIIVHCTAGISRSSAMAYLIKCKHESIEEGLKILNFDIHWPNEYIVLLGSKILKDYKVIDELERWATDNAEKRRSEGANDFKTNYITGNMENWK